MEENIEITGLNKLRARWRSGPLGRPDFLGAHILPCNKKKTDLQVFSLIGKTIKKLQCIPNTAMNTSVLECFDLLMDWETINWLH